MPLELYDRVKQKSTTAGTGNVTLTSSVATFLDFSAVYTDNDQLFYTIENLTDFEVGIGTYSGNTVSRDTVLKSSNSDSLLNLPGDTNTFVFVTYPASGAVHTSGNRCVVDIDGINFNVGAAPTYTEGRIFYDNQNHALAVYNDEPDITLQVGQEEFLRVRNNTSGTIFNGEAVRILGSQGTHVTVEKAIATGDFVAQAVGLATHDIENNSFGYVTTYGVVRDLDTSDFNDGDEIFLSPEVSGGLTGVSPIAPNYKLSLGHVVRSHPTVGQVVVKPSTPKLGGGDVKTLGNKVPSGVAFTEQIAGSDAAIIASTTGLIYDSGNQVLRVNAGGVRFPDGVTQTIAYTGQDAYNYWELQVGSDIDTITSTERVQFTGEGLVSVAYDPTKNTVTISGSEGAATGLSDPIYIDLNNQLSGSGSFKYAGDTASIEATLTAAAISGQTATTTIADPDNFIIERGAALRKVARSVVVTGLATTGELDSVSGYLQGQIDSNDTDISALQTATGLLDTRVSQNESDITVVSGIAQDALNASGYLQSQIDINAASSGYLRTDITALETATGNLDTRVTQNESDITSVSGLLYNNWNINVSGNVDSIESNQTVVFTGVGLTTVTYDNATNIVSISGAGDGSGTGGSTTGVASGIAFFNRTSNEITGVSNFIYNQVLNQVGINADPQAGLHVKNDTSAYPVLTVEAGAGQALPLARFIDENGIVVATIDYLSGTFANSGGITYPDGNTQVIAYTGQQADLSSYATTSYVNSVSGNLQGEIDSNDTDIANLQTATGNLDTRVSQNETDITALETATGNLDTRVTQNTNDITSVSGLLYNNWNINVTGNVDSITSNENVVFTGVGLTSVSYDSSTNTVSISGSADGDTTYTAGSGLTLDGDEFNVYGGTGLLDALYFPASGTGVGINITLSPSRFASQVPGNASQPRILVGFGNDEYQSYEELDGTVVVGHFNNSGAIGRTDGNLVFGNTNLQSASGSYENRIFGKSNMNSASNSHANVIVGFNSAFGLTDTTTAYIISSNQGANNASNIDGTVVIGQQGAIDATDFTQSLSIGNAASVEASGDKNIIFGYGAGFQIAGDNNIDIHSNPSFLNIIGSNSNKLNIGRTIVGDTSSKLLAIGNVGASDITPDATLEIKPNASTDIGLIVQGAASHTANLQEWQDNSENILAFVDTRGTVSGSGFIFQDGVTQTIAYTGQGDGDTTYTAGSGLTLDSTEFNIYGGTGNFKQIYYNEHDPILIGSPDFNERPILANGPNIFIGHNAGRDYVADGGSNTTGNVAVGVNAASGMIYGRQTAFIGTSAGNNTSGMIGSTLIGANAGQGSTDFSNTTVIGRGARNADNLNSCCIIGESTSAQNASSCANMVAIGTQAADSVVDFDDSITMGQLSSLQASGSYNIVMGYIAGYLIKGNRNIDIDPDNSSAATVIGTNSDKINIAKTIVGDTSSKLLAIGNVGASDITPDATLEIKPNASTDVGLIVQAAASHTANLQEWQDSSENVLLEVDANGNISGTATGIFDGGVTYPDGNTQIVAYTGQGGGSTSPGGSDSYVQFNDGGSFGGDANFTWNSGTATLNVSGSFTATTKSFLIDHPVKEGMKLQYASLEGPENGVYVRGTTDQSIIQLPDYWVALVDENSITVNLTPVGKFQSLYIIDKNNEHVTVGGVEGSYDYVVYGERKDVDKLEVEW